MRTMIVSDLHLGDRSGADVLRHAGARERLLRGAEGVERLVLLGDVLELRESSAETAMRAARPLFEELGSALRGGEIVLVGGNHDHSILRHGDASPSRHGGGSSALGAHPGERQPSRYGGGPSQLERLFDAGDAGPVAAALAGWAAPARLTVAHPGVWVRADVYAMHGHYLDCHAGPTNGERLMLAAMQRVRGAPRTLEDYESVTGSLYRGLERSAALRWLAGSRTVARAGRLASGRRGERAVNCERAAMGEVAARLGLGEAYVVFGHTHRAGPLPGEDAARWRGRLGARLVNCGCWTAASQAATFQAASQAAASQQAALSRAAGSQAAAEPVAEGFVGSCVIVDGDGPPAVVLLGGDGSGAPQAADHGQ